MTKQLRQFTVLNKVNFSDRAPEEVSTPVIASDADAMLKDLLDAIKCNNSDNFKALLSSEFIYAGTGLVDGDKDFTTIDSMDLINDYYVGTGEPQHNYMKRHNKYSETYTGDHHTRYFEYRFHYVRPVIETLFFENNELFRELVSQLAESSCDEEFHTAFVESLAGTDLKTEMMTPWNESKLAQITAGITNMSEYGKQLLAAKVARGHNAVALAHVLRKELEFIPLSNDSNTAKVRWLDFKFKFNDHLHSEDTNFIAHRGWKRVVSNIASIIFSAGILNLINFSVTGNFFFFNNTTTQQLVANLDNSTKPEPKRFKA